MEEQVAQAALAMVRPTTDATTRQQASAFLEEWTRTPQAWDVYAKWLHSFVVDLTNLSRTNHRDNLSVSSESLGMQLLCLTLLQAKIRREIPRKDLSNSSSTILSPSMEAVVYPPVLTVLRQELWDYVRILSTLSPSSYWSNVTTSCCTCMVALAIRCGMLPEFMQMIVLSSPLVVASPTTITTGNNDYDDSQMSSGSLPPVLAMRLLAGIPQEVEACQDLTTPQVTEQLMTFLEPVLDAIRRALELHHHHQQQQQQQQQPTLTTATTTATTTMTATSASINSKDRTPNHTLQLTALSALRNWAQTCHVTLSHLNTPTCGSQHAILPFLIQLLSHTTDPNNQPVTAATTHPNNSGTDNNNNNNNNNNNSHNIHQHHPTGNQTDIHTMPDPNVWEMACQALTEAILVPTDSCTPSREAATVFIWNAIPYGFVSVPLQFATQHEWYDTCHALATLFTTFVTEEIDTIITQPAQQACIQLLFHIQSHPHIPVVLTVLECWLTIQEIPYQARHDHWRSESLFLELVSVLTYRIAYPQAFTTWQEELDIDQSEWEELRRMVTDVLVSCYFLLRTSMIQRLVQIIMTTSTHWTTTEAALFALTTISKDVCARCLPPSTFSTISSNSTSTTTTSSSTFATQQDPSVTITNNDKVQADRHATAHLLLELVEKLLSIPSRNVAHEQHLYLLAAIINFCGSYSVAWNSIPLPPSALLHLLAYLQSAFTALPLESAKATRAIYIGCLSKMLAQLEDKDEALLSLSSSTTSHPESMAQSGNTALALMMLRSVRDCMDAALGTVEEQAMTTVAEGATRLMIHLKNPALARSSLSADLIHPLVQRCQATLQVIPDPSQFGFAGDQQVAAAFWAQPQVHMAVESLVRYLAVLNVIVRFCDAPQIPMMGELLLQELGPFLDQTCQCAARSGPHLQQTLLPPLIAIYKQLLRTVPQSVIAPTFTKTIQFVVDAFSYTQHPSTLGYIGAAVEVFGSTNNDASFQELLSHVTTVLTTKHLTSPQSIQDSTALMQAYFECLQRYILYCPAGLVHNPQFPTIISLAVECLSALEGEKESTRATLMFLSQLFGWHALRLSTHVMQILQQGGTSRIIREQLFLHGSTICHRCVAGLAGGPQMLWPAYSDCLYAIIQSVITMDESSASNHPNAMAIPTTSTRSLEESVAGQWMYSSMSSMITNHTAVATTSANSKVAAGMTDEISNQIIHILLNLAKQGSKGRPKAKMLLTDFAKITKGEMTPDALVTYTI